jgi:ribonuclease BN (tRNA processing enzyme)
MADSITLVGTGTCQLETERMASSVLIEMEGRRVLFDCGRGVTLRLAELGLRNDDIEHIVLSHFHPDHLSDLIPLLQAASWSRTDPRARDLHIYGPAGVKLQMERICALFEGDALLNGSFQLKVHEHQGGTLEIAGSLFEAAPLPPVENHGLKFSCRGKIYAVTGDSYFHEAEVEFLREVDLAIIDSGHISDEEIVELARQAQMKLIVCSHLYRRLDQSELQERARKAGYLGQLVVGRDRMRFELP